ncbi:helix-turn-helix domain-containing protein [Trichocoleus sp. FACHB-90]|uniref:helix-turn-helix transcriptional regulator n=1 Tax=Cyanophyceae TaxID=3028117 RepID=UPI001682EA16|nr:helix-turn-helix transcriptional regulator [Trichocoleus sp. FACHB-90]MBD1926492.1 helix-turn-helix domain-containing protein [Trichocoleus sp. FACHB-90]
MKENEEKEYLTPMKLRQRTGLTQVQFALLVGKSPSTIAKWEAREFIPKMKPSEIKRLCEAYQCTLEELIEAFEGTNSATAS